jgi:predicted metal-binding membrane protein
MSQASMSDSILPAATRPVFSLRRYLWQRPEWWPMSLCLAAWVAMLRHGWQGMSHAGHHGATFALELTGWMLMVAAMMLPLLMYSIRSVAFASLWARRHRAIAAFLLGYAGPWLAIGVAVAAILSSLHWLHSDFVAAGGFVLAALWLLTRQRKRAFQACHRTRPLAPLGWQADRDCILYGCMIGVSCARTCWPLMLACACTGHGLIAMAGGLFVGLYERRQYRPKLRFTVAATLMLAVYYSLLAVLPHTVMPGM